MTKFRQKKFTIQEGHYTGPKDMEEIPGALGLMTKGALAGSGIGAVVGGLVKDTTIADGAWVGAKTGVAGGLVTKLFLNYLHKPMSSVKYQEVDKLIRRQFGVYQVSGITVGDSFSKRASIEEKFSFNDRNVTDYKLNFAIHNNQVTMYTFGISKEELDKINKSLDYYCKKYFSMEYSAKVINLKTNSYSVNISFTNYPAISSFILELSNVLETKINLLDSDAIVTRRLSEASVSDEEKTFSVALINKHTLQKILADTLPMLTVGLISGDVNATDVLQGLVMNSLDQMKEPELAGIGIKSGNLDNKFLQAELRKLHYIEGFHYTIGDNKCPVNISIASGVLIITAIKDPAEKIKKAVGNFMTCSRSKNCTLFTYNIKKVSELELILKKFMSLNLEPNIFEEKVRLKLFSNIDKDMIEGVVKELRKNGVEDIELTDRAPSDVISVTSDLSNLKIIIPEDYDYAQYEIEDWIRTECKFVRSSITYERRLLILNLTGTLTKDQYIRLVKYLVKFYGFCSIITN